MNVFPGEIHMDNKIQELTEKLYREGVTKGEDEAREIIRKAEERSAQLVAEARGMSEKIVADARRQSEELKRTVDSEIKLSGQQALSTIKQQIVDLIIARIVDESVSKTLADPQAIKDLLITVVRGWKASSAETVSLSVLLPQEKQGELEKAFASDAQDLLTKGLLVSFGRHIKGGFQIGPSDSSFKISLTDEDFKEFFKEFLRPRTRKYLFGE